MNEVYCTLFSLSSKEDNKYKIMWRQFNSTVYVLILLCTILNCYISTTKTNAFKIRVLTQTFCRKVKKDILKPYDISTKLLFTFGNDFIVCALSIYCKHGTLFIDGAANNVHDI